MSDIQNKEKELLDRFGRENHWQVPEGYFESFAEKMMENLPEQQAPRFVEMTRWQKLKPYVYLAAMFAGIWLMMNVFGRFADNGRINLENPPERLAQLVQQTESQDMYMIPSSVMSDVSIETEVADAYDNFEDFEADFEATADEESEAIDEYIEGI